MKILSIQEAYSRKFERQKGIKGLKYHAAGHCVHIGKISPGCSNCFTPDSSSENFCAGVKCNLNCVYCTSNKKERDLTSEERLRLKVLLYRKQTLSDSFCPAKMSFSGGGEPLLYIDIITGYMRVLREMERLSGHKPWYYLYTNGILANSGNLLKLQDLGFDEIRFHLGASNFSKQVYANLKKSVRYFKVVSVETPSWPPHAGKLFEMLPIIEDIGVKHLNIGEVEVNEYNYKKISKIIPDAQIYQSYQMHLYDGGLVYDIMEEVSKKKYSYSVLDCSSLVKSIQRSPAKFVQHEGIEGLVAKH